MKFHLIRSPSSPFRSERSHRNSGSASRPFTATFANIGKLTPKSRCADVAELLVLDRLLLELVGREAEHREAAVAEVVVEPLQAAELSRRTRTWSRC